MQSFQPREALRDFLTQNIAVFSILFIAESFFVIFTMQAAFTYLLLSNFGQNIGGQVVQRIEPYIMGDSGERAGPRYGDEASYTFRYINDSKQSQETTLSIANIVTDTNISFAFEEGDEVVLSYAFDIVYPQNLLSYLVMDARLFSLGVIGQILCILLIIHQCRRLMQFRQSAKRY